MGVPTSIWIMCLITVIYVYDSTLFLYRNEVVVVARLRGQYEVKFGSDDFSFFGKSIFIPNILLPHRLLYRLSWRPDKTEQEDDDEISESIQKKLLGIGPYIWAMFVALFVLLPIGLYIHRGTIVIILTVIYFYLLAIIALILIFIERKELGIGLYKFAAISFESLICAPCALNMTRKVSLAISFRNDVAAVSKKLLKPLDYNAFIQNLLNVIDSQLLLEAEESTRFHVLRAYRGRISREMS